MPCKASQVSLIASPDFTVYSLRLIGYAIDFFHQLGQRQFAFDTQAVISKYFFQQNT